MDIDDWLRGIGLAQYAEIFRTNDIDSELLGQLTNDDLKDIGVAALGGVVGFRLRYGDGYQRGSFGRRS